MNPSQTPATPSRLSEYDLMELIVFDCKVASEGFDYAAAEYAPRFEFTDLQRLTNRGVLADLVLTRRNVIEDWWDDHEADGVDLCNKHVEAASARQDERCLWAVRFAGGNISCCETEELARALHTDASWGRPAVLRRSEPGGEWVEVAPAGPVAEGQGGNSGV